MNKYQAHNGLFGCATERGLITANYSVFCPCPKAQAAYFSLLYASPTYKAAFLVSCRGVGDGMMPLYSNAFGRVPSLVPPPDEQLQIAEHIRETLDSLRTAVSRVDHEIELLREYRTRLIADVVTGKLDVREAAAQLPYQDQELQPLDEADEISDAEEDDLDDLDEATEDAEP